jgi:PAS domain S-box-containing protein
MTQPSHPKPSTDIGPGSAAPVEPDRQSSPGVVTAPITANILLVDDDPKSLLAMETILAGPGRTIVTAESGEEALRHLLRQDFAVILLDVRMPRLDGLETAALIRQGARSRYTPIIFLSAVDTMDADVFRGLASGAVDYLFKPVVPEVLQTKVSVFVDLFRLREQVKQQAVQQSEERFRLLVEQVQDYAIILLDSKGVVQTWNATAQRVTGYAAAEIIGQSPIFLYTQEDRAASKREALLQTARTAGRVEDEGWRVRKDGSRFWANVVLTALHDESGQLCGFANVTRDITERKRAEAALQESEARFHVMADTAPVLVWTSGSDALRNFFNKPWLEFTGQTLEHELGNGWAEDIHPEDRQRCLEIYQSAFDARKKFKTEYRLRRADGEYRWILENGVPRHEPDGTFAGYIGSCIDITEDKRVADEIRRLNVELELRVFERTAQLEASNKELESFSYSVSHDLRAPLRSIDGFGLALLEDCADKLDAQGKDYLRRVRDATQRMARLIDDLLNLARVTREEMRRECVDLSALARSISADLKKTQPDRKVTFAIADGVVANGDAHLLRVALENLLGNAWKFTNKRPRTRIEFGVARQNGNSAYFVRDDGAGFDMTYAGKLFGAFQRLHSNQEFEGTGIGLATVKRVVRRHGGHVWAESAMGQGATFYFTLQPSEGKRHIGATG